MVDPEALGDLLAAQRASAQRLAALLAAADVATGEEDHLGLRREQMCGGGLLGSPRWTQLSPSPWDLTLKIWWHGHHKPFKHHREMPQVTET